MIVDIFIPCFIDQVYPETGMNMVKVLRKAGVEVHYNPNQTCCGQMAYNAGFREEARAVGEKFIADFPNDRYIVGPSASCIGFVRNYYPRIFHNSSLHNKTKQLVKNIYEFTDFLVNVVRVKDFAASLQARATFHDACAALRRYGIREEPRELLMKVNGLELVEMNESDTCCGLGDAFSLKFEPISVAMVEQKVQNALDTGAEYLITTEASCMINIDGYIRKNKLPLKTMHIADVLASGW